MRSPHIHEANMVSIFSIKDKAQLETIKLITNTSGLLFNAIREQSSIICGSEESYTAYGLIIFIHNDFNDLFKHEKYLNWKRMIIEKLPELSDQFIFAEKEAKDKQNLYQLKEKLKRINSSQGFFHAKMHDENDIKLLQQRITELYSEEDIVQILRETGRDSVAEAAKRYGVSEASIYTWQKRYSEMEADDVKRYKGLQ